MGHKKMTLFLYIPKILEIRSGKTARNGSFGDQRSQLMLQALDGILPPSAQTMYLQG